METYFGYIKTPQDALMVFEACRKNKLQKVQRRLTSKERTQIKSGSVFAWDEREAGMRRWTDGRTWSPSRVLGSFLTYRELDTKRRPRRLSLTMNKTTIGCSYKPNGLIKQSFSICTATHQKLHLISYYSKSDLLAGYLKQPSADPLLSDIKVQKGLYPELNPLDTSGGHSATIHNMRLSLSTPNLSRHLSMDTCSSSSSASPPSLSSSPSTCDDDLMSPSLSFPTSHSTLLLPPAQDIAWGKIPSSEDQRQLKALQTLLRL
ncbi:Gti1/Pac2 family-domain-containing protein [Sporodiniella umbellata]|nr:Gti1/Pac2 family-domain-containing protein [Sporodiniella umbellata]